MNSQFGNSTCPITDQTCKSTLVPTSDCNNITSTYNAVISDASYDLFCNANQPNGDIMNVWVYTFEDCIRACSSYDAMGDKTAAYCYGVSYTYTMHQNPAVVANSGNCWLKSVKHNASMMFAEVGVDSAFIYGHT